MDNSAPQSMTSPPPANQGKSFALRFISGKYQGGEFPLPVDGEIVIGRSSELDMVLVEDMVSRRHAKITVTGGQIFLQDLGSTNGSFVNGERIKRAKLNEGDRVLIGTSIIKLVAVDVAPALSDAKASLEDVAAGKRTSQVRTMTGSIAEIPLPDLLQLFGASKKSGVLVIRTDHRTGRVFLDKGRVVYAAVDETPNVTPIKCFYRILTWPDGTFDMEPGDDRSFENPIDMSTEGLLMEGMRQLDELKNLGDSLPSQAARLALALPLDAKLRDLSPEELDVLQIVLNHGRMIDVMDRSPLPDLETCQTVVRLVKGHYILAST